MTALDISITSRKAVATDASAGHHHGAAVAGIAWLGVDGSHAVDTVPTRSPVVAELAAILHAVTAHPGPLLVLSDCRPALRAIDQVRRTGVHPAIGSGQVGRECARLLHRIALLCRGRDVEMRWVKGHDGHPLNEGADRLAVQARRCVQNGGRLADITDLAARIAAEATAAAHIPAPRKAS